MSRIARTLSRGGGLLALLIAVGLSPLPAACVQADPGSQEQEKPKPTPSPKDEPGDEGNEDDPKGDDMGPAEKPKGRNRLAKEKSPYLLQHADNPVDWYPWGDEAFEKAKREDKPIFLSIGYSTCYWCHVMEHESFENDEIAAFLNEHFVSIKVDREERPDVDKIYMDAVQALNNGHGGWPLTALLTPEGKPFFGGTYFPTPARGGMPAFIDVLKHFAKAWEENRPNIDKYADDVGDFLKKHTEHSDQGEIKEEVLDKGYLQLDKSFDSTWGGFGGAPKFPRSMDLSFLMRYHKRKGGEAAMTMVNKTLEMMYRGGMYDHLGGGFHRYSTDFRWLVPHFEKMLYDNALLARTYLEAYQVTGREMYAQVAREILDYILRDMTHPDGGFYSAEDAGEPEKEGRFYVWKREEFLKIVGDEHGKRLATYFGVTETGNFEEETNILYLPVKPEEYAEKQKIDPDDWNRILSEAKRKLVDVRSRRERPRRDDKVITAWNGLMISAMAYASQVLGEEKYAEAAVKASDFILAKLVRDGRLLRRHREVADFLGYIDDYAFFVMGLLDLYEATFDDRHFREAVRLTESMHDLFWDEEKKGYFFVGKDGEALIARSKEVIDSALPSGNSIAALNLLRLAEWTSDEKWRTRAEETLGAYGDQIAKLPRAHLQSLSAIDFMLDKPKEIVLAGEPGSEDFDALARTIRQRFLPSKVVALAASGDGAGSLEDLMPMLKEKGKIDGKATAYVCENYTCKQPVTDPEALAKQLE